MPENLVVTVIGLGTMGWGAALSLLRAGFKTQGVDLRPEVLDRFAALGGQSHTTPAAAAVADVIFVFVVNADQVRAVLFGPAGAVAAARPGTIFVLCVTMPPRDAISIAGELAACGMASLDAPVSGGAAKALSGEMTIMASGPDATFSAAAPALAAMSAKVFRLGDVAGIGSQVKMINQLLAGVHIAATAEALVLAAGVGLDLRTVHEVISQSAGASWMFQNRGPHIIDGDYAPRSAVDIFVKDLAIVAGEAAGIGVPTPLTTAALALFAQAQAAGLGREDDAAVAKVLARAAGLQLPGDVG